jgi:hypothetical protein
VVFVLKANSQRYNIPHLKFRTSQNEKKILKDEGESPKAKAGKAFDKSN